MKTLAVAVALVVLFVAVVATMRARNCHFNVHLKGRIYCAD